MLANSIGSCSLDVLGVHVLRFQVHLAGCCGAVFAHRKTVIDLETDSDTDTNEDTDPERDTVEEFEESVVFHAKDELSVTVFRFLKESAREHQIDLKSCHSANESDEQPSGCVILNQSLLNDAKALGSLIEVDDVSDLVVGYDSTIDLRSLDSEIGLQVLGSLRSDTHDVSDVRNLLRDFTKVLKPLPLRFGATDNVLTHDLLGLVTSLRSKLVEDLDSSEGEEHDSDSDSDSEEDSDDDGDDDDAILVIHDESGDASLLGAVAIMDDLVEDDDDVTIKSTVECDSDDIDAAVVVVFATKGLASSINSLKLLCDAVANKSRVICVKVQNLPGNDSLNDIGSLPSLVKLETLAELENKNIARGTLIDALYKLQCAQQFEVSVSKRGLSTLAQEFKALTKAAVKNSPAGSQVSTSRSSLSRRLSGSIRSLLGLGGESRRSRRVTRSELEQIFLF